MVAHSKSINRVGVKDKGLKIALSYAQILSIFSIKIGSKILFRRVYELSFRKGKRS